MPFSPPASLALSAAQEKLDPRLVRFSVLPVGVLGELLTVDRAVLAGRDAATRALRLPAAGPASADLPHCGPAAAWTAGVRVEGEPPHLRATFEVLVWLAPGAAVPGELAAWGQLGDVAFGLVDHADVDTLASSADVLAVELAGATLAQAPVATAGPAARRHLDQPPPRPRPRRPAATIGVVDQRFDLLHPDLCWRPGLVGGWPVYEPDSQGRRSKVRALFDVRADQAWGSGLVDLELEAWSAKALSSTSLSPYAQLPHQPVAGWSGAIDDHGTMAAWVAAGLPHTARWRRRGPPHPSATRPAAGACPDSELLLVALDSSRQTADVAHVPTVADVLRGVTWMEGQLADPGEPLVVNLSLATPFGPHDGRSLASLALDAFCAGPGRAVVVAAGNDNLLGRHVRVHDDEGEGCILAWEVAGTADDATPGAEVAGQRPVHCDGLQVWIASEDAWNGGRARRRAVLRVPDGGGAFETITADPGKRVRVRVEDPNTCRTCVVWLDNRAAWAPNGCARIEVGWEPGEGGTVPLGPWQLALEPMPDDRATPRTVVDAWLGVNDATCIRWVRPAAMVHEQTLSDLATGQRVLAVGDAALTRRPPVQPASPYTLSSPAPPAWLAPTSGCGPTRDERNKPDFTAPGTLITVPCARDRRDGAERPVELIRFACGTSVSAPVVAGLCARLLGQDPGMDVDDLRHALRSQAATTTGTEHAWGQGLLLP